MRALRICRNESAARSKVKIRRPQIFLPDFSGISRHALVRAARLSRQMRSAYAEIEGAVAFCVECSPGGQHRDPK
jgi:hypothetical protein